MYKINNSRDNLSHIKIHTTCLKVLDLWSVAKVDRRAQLPMVYPCEKYWNPILSWHLNKMWIRVWEGMFPLAKKKTKSTLTSDHPSLFKFCIVAIIISIILLYYFISLQLFLASLSLSLSLSRWAWAFELADQCLCGGGEIGQQHNDSRVSLSNQRRYGFVMNIRILLIWAWVSMILGLACGVVGNFIEFKFEICSGRGSLLSSCGGGWLCWVVVGFFILFFIFGRGANLVLVIEKVFLQNKEWYTGCVIKVII